MAVTLRRTGNVEPDYLTVDLPAPSGVLTFAGWIKPASVPGTYPNRHGLVFRANESAWGYYAVLAGWDLQVGFYNNTTYIQSSGASGGSVGAWLHIGGVWDWSSTTATLRSFAAGAEVASTTGARGVPGDSTDHVYIGAMYGTTPMFEAFDGDVAEFAVWNRELTAGEWAALAKGIAPPVAAPVGLIRYLPLIRDVNEVRSGTAAAHIDGGTSDRYPASTVSYLRCNGANGSTTFTDELGHAWTANGNAQISTASSRSGGASAKFDGSNDWLSATISGLNVGTGDFTLEFWMNGIDHTSGTPNYARNLVDLRTAEPEVSMYIFLGSSNAGQPYDKKVVFWVDGAARITSSVETEVGSGWHHVAVVRNSGTTTLYVDGTSRGTYSDSNSYTQTAIKLAGRFAAISGDQRSLNGYMDEFRFSNVARYTSNFTPQLDYTPRASAHCRVFR